MAAIPANRSHGRAPARSPYRRNAYGALKVRDNPAARDVDVNLVIAGENEQEKLSALPRGHARPLSYRVSVIARHEDTRCFRAGVSSLGKKIKKKNSTLVYTLLIFSVRKYFDRFSDRASRSSRSPLGDRVGFEEFVAVRN